MLSAAASSAPFLALQPQAQFVMRQVLDTVGDSVVLVSPQWPSALGPGIASATGAVGGAALGSAFGPAGTGLGALAGALASGKAEMWLAHRPEVINLAGDSAFTLAPIPGSGKLMLSHRELPRKPGSEGMAVAMLAQASLRGCWNLWSFSQGEMSGRDVALALIRDVRDGAVVWATCQGVLKVLTLGELWSAGLFGHACSAALHNPAPLMFGVLGAGWTLMRCAHFSMDIISLEQLQADAVLACGANMVGITVNIMTGVFDVPILGRAVLTCTASQAAGLWIYEAWRARKQIDAETRLRAIAAEVLGLAPLHSAEDLRRRWRILARLSHPDRNRRNDAKRTFAVFSLCRDALRDGLARRQGGGCHAHASAYARPGSATSAAGCFRGLLRNLRRADWVDRGDLPVPGDLPSAGRRSAGRPLQQAAATAASRKPCGGEDSTGTTTAAGSPARRGSSSDSAVP